MALLEGMEFDSTELAQVYYLREWPAGTFVFPLQYREHNTYGKWVGDVLFMSKVIGTAVRVYSDGTHQAEQVVFVTLPRDMVDGDGYKAWIDWQCLTDAAGGGTFGFRLTDGTINRTNEDDFEVGTQWDILHPPIQSLASRTGVDGRQDTDTSTLDLSGVTGSYCTFGVFFRDAWDSKFGSMQIYGFEIRDSDNQTVWSAGNMGAGLLHDQAAGTSGQAWLAGLGNPLGTGSVHTEITVSRETTIKTEGDSSLRVDYRADGAGSLVVRTFATSVDVQGADEVRFDVRTGTRTGGNFDIILIDTDGGTHSTTPNIAAAGSWYTGSISLT